MEVRSVSGPSVEQHETGAALGGADLQAAERVAALLPDRPGARAATAHAVLRPLADAGLDKAAVRRRVELPLADLPRAVAEPARRAIREAVVAADPDVAVVASASPTGFTAVMALTRQGRVHGSPH